MQKLALNRQFQTKEQKRESISDSKLNQ